jgi:hypothetical protein
VQFPVRKGVEKLFTLYSYLAYEQLILIEGA